MQGQPAPMFTCAKNKVMVNNIITIAHAYSVSYNCLIKKHMHDICMFYTNR